MGCGVKPFHFRIYDELMTTATDKPRIFALIPCAGNGSRSARAGPKQYQTLHGQAMVAHTLNAFQSLDKVVSGLWVVVSPDDDGFLKACPGFGAGSEVLLKCGGVTRAASVLNGLKAMLAVASPGDWVLVHDAARCLITPEQIMSLVEACQNDAVGGLLAQPLPDTLKQASGGRVSATIDRSDKWLAQTPQMFRIGALIDALERARDTVTDEASAMEAMGFRPLLVPGSAQNFKVTYPQDFALAEAVLASRAASEKKEHR